MFTTRKGYYVDKDVINILAVSVSYILATTTKQKSSDKKQN